MIKPNRHELNFILIFLLVTLIIAVYTLVLQNIYARNTLDAAVSRDTTCSDAVHALVTNTFTKADFTDLNTMDAMDLPRYQSLQALLNRLRTLNSTRYLYTAGWGDHGQPVYLVDGLNLDAEDFAYPGTDIEPEMVPYIEAALNGETIYSQDILDTTWGHIFTACYPLLDAGGEIMGALCVEIDMESSYRFLSACNRTAFLAAATTVVVTVLVCILLYISFRKQTKKEREQQALLADTAARAEAANKAKSAFLFNMSHDIRTPMNAVLGYAELADHSADDPEALHRYLQNIRSCGEQMLDLLNNVLELARIESGHITIEETPTATGTVLENCMVMFRPEAAKKHQQLTLETDTPYPYVYIDATRLNEIWLNIISNAIKYTGDGGSIHCSLRYLPHPSRDGWCVQEFRVADTGVGMSQEFLTHIYETFSREYSTTVSGVAGTGLGMGIVKKMVDAMHGTIDIQSTVGKGTTVTIRTPLRIASEEEALPKRAEVTFPMERLKGKRVLLAEDNDLNAEIATALLTEAGLLVERAADGVQCVELLDSAAAGYYDLILMDIQMPTLDGYETTRKIRRMADPDKAGIPIVAMTANAFAEDRQQALQVGMNDHVAKPIDMNKLIPVLEKYL